MPPSEPPESRAARQEPRAGDDSDTLLLDLRPGKTALPDKQFFKIGEAADIVGVKAHVLRYWESEFGALRPLKTRGSHRMYRRADVELACLIRRLLHDEGYTIPGAKKRVRELIAAARTAATASPESRGAAFASRLGPAESADEVRKSLASRSGAVDAQASRELGLRAELIHLRNELSSLLSALDRKAASQAAEATAEPSARATVTAVVAKTSLLNQRPR